MSSFTCTRGSRLAAFSLSMITAIGRACGRLTIITLLEQGIQPLLHRIDYAGRMLVKIHKPAEVGAVAEVVGI